jgi:hypothetical protein
MLQCLGRVGVLVLPLTRDFGIVILRHAMDRAAIRCVKRYILRLFVTRYFIVGYIVSFLNWQLI